MTSVVGIDLSLASTGVALIDTAAVPGADLRRIRTTGHRDDTLAVRTHRLAVIATEVQRLVRDHAPDLVVIEAPAFGQIGGSTHDRAGLWWLVVEAVHDDGYPVAEVSPAARAKYATGVGAGPKASKDAVLAAVVRRYPTVEVDGNDVADALLLAALGCRHLGDPIEEHLPAVHLDALGKVRWPGPRP